jgi:glycosyltransferase involved in cell wall biosynthesis
MAIERLIDGFIFITDNEAEAFQAVGGSWRHGAVIFNVAPSFDDPPQPHPAVPVDSRFKIASLANFAHVRGIDRIVELARELAKCGRRDFLFVLAGDSKIPAFLDGELGEIGRRGGTFADYAAAKGVSDMVLCLGHVGDPERVLASCDALVKLSRRDEPWGRDVIEALSLGRPVLATGTWSCFVETGVTGHLSCPFDARACAAQLLRWADDRSIPRALGAAGIERMKQMCDGPTNAAKLLSFWSSVAQARASATRVPRTSRLLNLT